MIPLTRNADAEFPTNFTGTKKVEWERELLEDQKRIKLGEIEKHDFQTGRWKVTKEQLKKETHSKCAYCEVHFSVVAYGDVEHYRPKSIYWWLAYAYENYLPSCQICNQKFKSNKFPRSGRKMKAPRISINTTDAFITRKAGTLAPDPIDDTAGLSISDFVDAHQAERPLIINPYIDNPADYLAYEINDVERIVKVVAPDSSTEKFVTAAEKIYGINRKELNELRYLHLLSFRVHRATLEDTGISDSTKLLNQRAIAILKSNRFPFAGMVRYFDNLQNLPPIPDLDDIILLSPFGGIIV